MYLNYNYSMNPPENDFPNLLAEAIENLGFWLFITIIIYLSILMLFNLLV